ncbi:Hypothetical protein DPCES_3919 [Desulfitobacterium hafniense]|uniref:Uncharacterized protein n=1 Tax=Desulfitobacterium hafniense TaxID=49338 RepID=A0A098B5Z4_DESHA|nr:Hypothetical protein DPCES_3919 [Desulfitobacterium hafniense]
MQSLAQKYTTPEHTGWLFGKCILIPNVKLPGAEVEK